MSRPVSDALDDLDWFDAGNGVFDHVLTGPGVYPPLDDLEAQRQWLAGQELRARPALARHRAVRHAGQTHPRRAPAVAGVT